jgi:hypothetical protein
MQFFVVAGFYLNRDYIAKNLCENRFHPEKKCCGKCYLNKQLKKTEKEDSKSGSQTSKAKNLQVLFCESNQAPIVLSQFFSVGSNSFPEYSETLHPPFCGQLLRPPCA